MVLSGPWASPWISAFMSLGGPSLTKVTGTLWGHISGALRLGMVSGVLLTNLSQSRHFCYALKVNLILHHHHLALAFVLSFLWTCPLRRSPGSSRPWWTHRVNSVPPFRWAMANPLGGTSQLDCPWDACFLQGSVPCSFPTHHAACSWNLGFPFLPTLPLN